MATAPSTSCSSRLSQSVKLYLRWAMPVPTATGRMVPILQVAHPVMTWEPGVLWREGRHFAVTVQGDVREGVQGPTGQQGPVASNAGASGQNARWLSRGIGRHG